MILKHPTHMGSYEMVNLSHLDVIKMTITLAFGSVNGHLPVHSFLGNKGYKFIKILFVYLLYYTLIHMPVHTFYLYTCLDAYRLASNIPHNFTSYTSLTLTHECKYNSPLFYLMACTFIININTATVIVCNVCNLASDLHL